LTKGKTFSFDPVYSDAKAKAASLGEFNFFNAWMSQPKSQLETFRAWAGKDSDIRCDVFYLNLQILRSYAIEVIISPLIISTSVVGFFKREQYPHAWLPALPPESPQVNHIAVFQRQKIRLPS
jgi:hypothetical protein